MHRRDFIKSVAISLGMATVGFEPFGGVPPLYGPDIIRRGVTFTSNFMMASQSDIEEMIGKALEECKKTAKLLGWKKWKTTIRNTTEHWMDSEQYDVTLIKTR